jgi:hypothetical protein
MDKIWSPLPTEVDTVYSDWYYTDLDYESAVIAERSSAVNASQPVPSQKTASR